MPRPPDLLSHDDLPVTYGRYTITGVLGEGGMARVFSAEIQGPSGFRKQAALKVIRSMYTRDNLALKESLINEARLGGLLHHSNIVETYDFGEIGGQPFIAMELVRGVELHHLLHHLGKLPPEIAVELGIQLCAGLEAAHNLEDVGGETELVHRDLKPGNLMLNRDGVLKVLDFGIAKATRISADITSTGVTKGTPAYMSPEQTMGDELDRRSDLFAVGLLLWEMLTGERFFNQRQTVEVLMAIQQIEAHLTHERLMVVERLAPGMGRLIQRSLRADRVMRYADAAEIEVDLRQIARELPPPPSLRRWVRELMEELGVEAGGQLSPNPTPPPPVQDPEPAAPSEQPEPTMDPPLPSPAAERDDVDDWEPPRKSAAGWWAALLLVGAAAAWGWLQLHGEAPEVEPLEATAAASPQAVEPMTPAPTPRKRARQVVRPKATPARKVRDLPQPTPAPTSEAAPDATPQATPEPTPKPKPEATPEPTPDAAPEVTPEPTPNATPEPTPQATPEPTPQATPEPTPDATPQATPEAIPETTPEPTPHLNAAPLLLSAPRAARSSAEGDPLEWTFSVRLDGGRDPVVVLHLLPHGVNEWVVRKMALRGGAHSYTQAFPQRYRGVARWWVEVQDGDQRLRYPSGRDYASADVQ